MKRPISGVLIAVSLAGCSQRETPASAYRNWGDRLAVAIGLRDLGLVWPCYVKTEETKVAAGYAKIPTDQCFKMDPPHRWRGLWRNNFEGSRFCPAPAKQCILQSPGDLIWLDASQSPDGGLYAVDFVGRRTAIKGRYGHMGVFDHELIVDRMISIKQLEPPVKRPERGTLK